MKQGHGLAASVIIIIIISVRIQPISSEKERKYILETAKHKDSQSMNKSMAIVNNNKHSALHHQHCFLYVKNGQKYMLHISVGGVVAFQ